jgi:hypothetical protein
VRSKNIFTASQKLSVSGTKDKGNQNRIRLDWLNSKRFFFHGSRPPHFAQNVRATVSVAAEVYIVVFLENPNENTKLLKSFRASEFA